MFQFKRIIPRIYLVLFGVTGILAFQNCAPQIFSAIESASNDNSGMSAVKVTAPGLCRDKGALEFVLSFQEPYSYECFDLTKQAHAAGPLCSSGPEVVNFTTSSNAAQNCS